MSTQLQGRGILKRRTFLGGLTAAVLAVSFNLGFTGQALAQDKPKRTPPAIDAAWKPLAEEYGQLLRLEAQAALANKSDPKKYPVASLSPFQKSVVALVDKMKPEARKKALDRAVQETSLPPAQKAAKYNRLQGINPYGKVTIQAQYEALVKGRSSLITRAMLDGLVGGDFAKEVAQLKQASKTPQAAAKVNGAVHTLRLELVEFHVVDDTTGWGDDEVRLGGVALRTNGSTAKLNSFALGSFSSGQKKTYTPPKKLYDFNLTLTNKYPKNGVFILSIAESEEINESHQEAIKDLLIKLEEWAKDELNKAAQELGMTLAGLIGSPVLGPVLGAIIGEIADFIVHEVFDWIADFFEDDLFFPSVIPFKVTTPAIWPNGATHGPNHAYWVTGHGGHYKFKVRWAKVN